MQETKLRWFGHEQRRCTHALAQRCKMLSKDGFMKDRGNADEVSGKGN